MSSDDHANVFEARVRALVAGLHAEVPPTASAVVFGGRAMTYGEVVAALQQIVEAFDAVRTARVALRHAVSERRAAMKGFRSTYDDAVILIKHHLGKANPRLVAFGVALPRPRRQLTAEAAAIARARAAATRKARGTLGRRQRQSLGRPREPTLQVFSPSGQPLVPLAGGSAAVAEPPPANPEPGGVK